MSSSFTDSQGREWTVVVNGKVLVRARNHGKINIGEIFNAATGEMRIDPALLLDLCYYGCEHNSKIASGKVSKDEFLEMLVGKTMANAIEATGKAIQTCFAAPEETDNGEEKKIPFEENASA